METPSGDMPTHSNYTIDLSVGDTSTFSTEVREHDDASSDDPGRLPYLDRLTDRVVTGDLDIDIWVWMIEYLAKFKKELWMLHDVFEMSPNVPDYMGEHTKEMVAFRCLAYLFDPTTAQDSNVASGVESKIEFNLSESCEYVLQCILDETPLSDLKSGAPELSKWNLLPFIENKRISLPKCALELLRGASCETCTGIFPSNRQETMRIDGNNSGQVTLEQQRPILGKENDSSCCKSNRCNVTVPDSLEENDEVKRDRKVL
ncbi:PREDICTED: uncharacterized protein LOC104821902 isoform X2 [Tarenaya hassleriana]|uniref:uncharacterized protein LOC104821902 isoform X2 n=1 Tax=Tarenaya hassleriana TaxID=28532 RepID=UPI00053C81DE|nr:PREDICTED: uncharacterized protein LOC104821902 isoform X2 [Tarenaya hassleriana]